MGSAHSTDATLHEVCENDHNDDEHEHDHDPHPLEGEGEERGDCEQKHARRTDPGQPLERLHLDAAPVGDDAEGRAQYGNKQCRDCDRIGPDRIRGHLGPDQIRSQPIGLKEEIGEPGW